MLKIASSHPFSIRDQITRLKGLWGTKKVAIVTGASQGIGKSIALMLAQRGWAVWATTRDLKKCTLNHKKIHWIEVKLGSEQSIKKAVQHILNQEGHIDALINNAGQMLIGSCEETPVESTRSLFEINVMAPIRLAQAILPSMRTRKQGRIINLSSGAAIQAVPGLGAFSASKAALYSYFQALSAEVIPWNIKITSLEVSSVSTPWFQNCSLHEVSDVKEYHDLCTSLTKKLNEKNEAADKPDDVATATASLLEHKSPPLRKPASSSISNFMKQQLVDDSGERYMQQQRALFHKNF